MRILMIADFYHPFLGGVEQHVRSLSATLVEHGHDVTVATLGQPGLPDFEEDHGVRVYRIQGTAQRFDRLFSSTERPWAPPLPDPGLVRGLQLIVARERPEIVHGHDWLSRSFLPLKWWSGAKLVVSLHYYTLTCAKKNLLRNDAPCSGPGVLKCLGCSASHYGTAKGLGMAPAAWIGALSERGSADRLIAVSRATASGNGIDVDDARCMVIPNFLPPERGGGEDVSSFIAQLPKPGYLMYVGDLRRAKGLDVLLDAYSRFENAPPLVLIGKVWPETPKSFPPNVLVFRNWPNAAVLEAWNRASLAIMPSIWPEPFGIVVIEAMSRGCPVICSDIGGMPDIVVDGESGRLVPPGDARSLYQAIDALLRDPALMARMSDAARERARAYRADTVVSQIEDLYRQVLRDDIFREDVVESTPATDGSSPEFSPNDAATLSPTPPKLVSIVINNHNYDQFVADAIESALNQTYPAVEVIVVDDGSTDDSRQIIARYDGRVRPLFKENGGQISAFTAGVQASTGEIVIFLDSDDRLLPHVCAEVVAAFEAHPGAAKVQFRLEIIDAEGKATGGFTPPRQVALSNGDLRSHMLQFPDDVCTPPTSGNAFAAETLHRILPPPTILGCTSVYDPTGADMYLHNLAPLFGEVVSLPEIGGQYRVHGTNSHYTSTRDVSQMRKIIVRSSLNHQFIVHNARQLGLSNVPESGDDITSVTYLANRLASLKLDPSQHPIQSDTRLSLLWAGVRASARRFDLRASRRLLAMSWFAAAALGPAPFTGWLLDLAFYPEKRGRGTLRLSRSIIKRSRMDSARG